MGFPSDLEIARGVAPKPIGEIAATLGFTDAEIEPHGRTKAKISIEGIERLEKSGRRGKYVVVTAITPTQHLLEVAPLSEARYTIESLLPGEQEAKLLGISRRDPCLVLKRLTFSRGVPVTHVRLTHPGSRYLLQGRFET